LQSGQLSVVGEKGPELFRPEQTGTVIPNNQIGGGSNVEVNIINESSGTEVETQERQGPDGKRVLEARVTDLVDRNLSQGKHDKALKNRFGARPQTRQR